MSKAVTALDRLLGLLTRDNDAQIVWLKKFIAWTIQHPEIKQQVAPVIIGGQGIGKTVFGNTFMQALFGELAGQSNPASLENNFLITPFVGKLIVYIDEVRIGSAAAINEVKKLVRETRISGEAKFKDRKDYRIYSRLILTANQADIGLNPEDAADRALFFIMSWNDENRHQSKHEFNQWTIGLKDFFTDFTDMLERVDVRQHLMRYFMDIEVKRRELEDLTHSSRDDASVVKATMSKARKVARAIAADRPHHRRQRSHRMVHRPSFARRDPAHGRAAQPRRAERGDGGIRGCEPGRASAPGRGRLFQIPVGLRQNPAGDGQGPQSGFASCLAHWDWRF